MSMCSSGGVGGAPPPPLLPLLSLQLQMPPLPPLPPPPPLPLPLHPSSGPPPGADPHLVDAILAELKSQGIFDQFRKECISDVDTKPAYQNLRQRVEGSVSGFLSSQNWSPDLNKNQLREKLRKHIHDSNFLDQGVERIVDQVVNPKIASVFIPQVEEIFYKYLGIEKPEKLNNDFNGLYNLSSQMETGTDDLLPNDLEAVSPESVKSFDKSGELIVDDEKSPTNVDLVKSSIKVGRDSKVADHSEDSINSNDEEFESPAFEPLEDNLKEEGCSKDSHLSGISDLTSHDSNISSNANDFKTEPDVVTKIDTQNNNSQLSQVSSDSNLSIEAAKKPIENVKIDFQNTFSNIKNDINSSNACDEPMDTSVTVNKQNYHKYDDGDNSSDARQCFEESSEPRVLEAKSFIENCSVDEIYYKKNKSIETDDIEMAKSTSSNEAVTSVTQHHRDSVESKTSTDSTKIVGSIEMSLDSSESNSVFTKNAKHETEIQNKNLNSFENKINTIDHTSEAFNDNSNGSKNNKTEVSEGSEVIHKLSEEDKNKEFLVKSGNSENKNYNSNNKERERHSSSSSGKDKDKKDSRSYSRSRSGHSSSRRDSERKHSSSHDKKDSSSSTNKTTHSSKDSHSDHKSHEKQRKSSRDESRRDSYKEKHGTSRSSSSYKSSKYSSDSKHEDGHKTKHSTSDRTARHELKDDDKCKNRDSLSKSVSKTEGNREKNYSTQSTSHSKYFEHSESSKGKSSHHSSRKDKSGSRNSHSDKNIKSSSTSDDKKNDEKKGKKSGNEDNCSTSYRNNRNRRSTDRDSNDGYGGTGKGSSNSKNTKSTSYSPSQKTKISNSSGESNSNGNSSQSDGVAPDTVNITSGKYIKSEFNMFEFGSMGAIKRHNLTEKSCQVTKSVDINNSAKSPDSGVEKSPDISISNISSPVRLASLERSHSIESPEIPNKKPVIHIDSQLKPSKYDEISLNLHNTFDILKKPKCASNVFEVMKVMKIRKQMEKNEQKRKQNAILLMEQQHNVPKNSSQAFSGISGPEVELTCMTSYDKEIDTKSQLSAFKESIKYFDSKINEKLTTRIESLKQYILQLENDCEEYEFNKKQLNEIKFENCSNLKNGYLTKNLRVTIERIDDLKNSKIQKSSSVNEINSPIKIMPCKAQNGLIKEDLDYSHSDLDYENNRKDSQPSQIMNLLLNQKSEQDVLEIILGGEVSLDKTTISFNSDSSIECNGITKEKSCKKFVLSNNNTNINKPTRLTRKRASTSSYDSEKNLENDNKVITHNNNNNELIGCSVKKRKITKKMPLAEKDVCKRKSLVMTENCEIRVIKLENSNKMPDGSTRNLSFTSNETLDVMNENKMNCQEIPYSLDSDKSIDFNNGVKKIPLKLKVEIHESGTNEDNPINTRLKRSSKLILDK